MSNKPCQNIGALPLHVLHMVKAAQQQHGLRHENFQRYAGYCSRRIVRVRRALKFTNVYKCIPNRTARFIPRPVTADQLTDSRYLEICVFEVERHWAFYKQLKIDYEQKHPRKIFHARRKLRRAVKCAKTLNSMVAENEQLDEITRNEVSAYSSFIEALLRIEFHRFDEGVTLLETAKSTYDELLKLVKPLEIIEIYSQHQFMGLNHIDKSVCDFTSCFWRREIDFLIGACRGDASALLSGVNDLNLSIVEAEANEPKKPPVKKPVKEKKEPRPLKPFFFDLAFNFVNDPEAFK